MILCLQWELRNMLSNNKLQNILNFMENMTFDINPENEIEKRIIREISAVVRELKRKYTKRIL